MKCFSEDAIQRFVDGELTEIEVKMVESHLAECSECKRKVEYQKQQSTDIKKVLNELVGEIPEMPKIESVIKKERAYVSRRRKFVYGMVAASVLWMLFLVSDWQQSKCSCDKIIYYSMDFEVDANKPISDQEITVKIIDQDGKPIERENMVFDAGLKCNY